MLEWVWSGCKGRGLYLSMVDEDLEEGVHQQDSVGQDAAAVQQHRLQITTSS